MYIPYNQIDKIKWDSCIINSINSLIYARSFYLDNMAENWDALVLNDYEFVMPLTWKRKFGFSYLYQPAFVQQGGIFSRYPVTDHHVQLFLEEAQKKFKFAELTFNYKNLDRPSFKSVDWKIRTNYILDLTLPYNDIFDNYQPSFTKSLRRIKKFNLIYEVSDDYKSIIKLYRDLYSKRLPFFTKKDFFQFEEICDLLSTEKKIITRIALNSSKELVAAVILLNDGKRLYNMISCITLEGKRLEANYFLYDKIISEFGGTALTLDLEGSDVEGIAAFYKKFNPQVQPYYFAKYNILPEFVRFFKS